VFANVEPARGQRHQGVEWRRSETPRPWLSLERRDLHPIRQAGYMTELVFFHHASRTLILADLIDAFEPQKLGLIMRWLTKLGGV
jgi:hypothetical protein